MNLQSTDFELFDVPARFAQDRAQLDARWKQLQREVHPDRFAAQGAAAQRVHELLPPGLGDVSHPHIERTAVELPHGNDSQQLVACHSTLSRASSSDCPALLSRCRACMPNACGPLTSQRLESPTNRTSRGAQ